MGKAFGEGRYLSVAELRELFVDRRLPRRITQRLESGQRVTRSMRV
jgi:hypothetical protein